jgi:indolepyruvate ferredoxin oxidoreductase alpha subunit
MNCNCGGLAVKDSSKEVMIGNFGIARGLVEAGLELAAAYPGTPSSEIIPGIIEFNRRENRGIHAEWSVNERCALEVAFGAAAAGKKAACMMKQVGLNVAFPSLLKVRKKRINGALVIVSCDDPGPQSSQTEQDTRLIAALLGIPVFDPASPQEASDMAFYALQYSYEHKVPVILRSTHRVSHARENIAIHPPGTRKTILDEGMFIYSVEQETGVQGEGTEDVKMGRCEDESSGQACKPASLQAESGEHPNHSITQSLNHSSSITHHQSPITNHLSAKLGIIASGMSFSIAADVISELNAAKLIPIYKVVKINPVDPEIYNFADNVDKILILEETDSVLELIIHRGRKVYGRKNGYVPAAGELTYDIIRNIVEQIMEETGIQKRLFTPDYSIEEAMKEIALTPRPPKLCAGCPHRAAFYAMQYAYPKAIFPGDIGCYTLGISMGAVDTCIDMGGGVNLASGFYNTFNQDKELIPIIASIGDSTFFHAGLEPLYNAVKTGKKFILVIMDNSTTAMTGMQPTPQSGISAEGTQARSIKIEDIAASFGVKFLKIVDPYDVPLTMKTVRDAFVYLKETGNGPAVIITRRECLLRVKGQVDDSFRFADIEENCNGCKHCIQHFECPALIFDETAKKVKIDEGLCVRCGICLYVCPSQDKAKILARLSKKAE